LLRDPALQGKGKWEKRKENFHEINTFGEENDVARMDGLAPGMSLKGLSGRGKRALDGKASRGKGCEGELMNRGPRGGTEVAILFSWAEARFGGGGKD